MQNPSDVRIAFLGVGLMGAPMAERLLKAGFSVIVWNRSRAKAQALEPSGASVAETAAQAARGADVIITMLSDGPAVEAVLFGEGGVAAAAKPGAVFIDMSSANPDEAREHSVRLEALGFGHIDAPVSGGVAGAEAGTLAILAGGEAQLIERLAPVFKAMGRVTRVGPSGAGQVAKLANQQIVAVTLGALSEAMVLVEAAGGDRRAFRDAIRGGFCESRILELHGGRMVERDFQPGGPSKHQLKDLRNVLKAAAGVNLSLPLTESVTASFDALCETGVGAELDHSALLLQVELLNGKPAPEVKS